LIKPDIGNLEKSQDINGLMKIVNSTRTKELRQGAIEALGRLNNPAALSPLFFAASDRKRDTFERGAAIRAIARIKSPESTRILSDFLKNKEFDERSHVVRVIQQEEVKSAVPSLVTALYDDNIKIREQSAEALYSFGWTPDNDRDDAYYSAASGSFGKTAELLGADAIDIILGYVKDDENKNASRSGLEYIKDPKAVDRLIRLLHYRGCFFPYNNSYVKKSVIKALGGIGDPKAANPLLAILNSPEESADVRGEAILALGKIGDPSTMKYLIDLLKDRDSCRYAAQALGSRGDPGTVNQLIDNLDSDDYFSRCEIIRALGKIGDSRAVDPLIAAYKKAASYDISAEIIEALGKIGDERAMELLLRVSSEFRDQKWDDYKLEGSDMEYIGFEKRQRLGHSARSAMEKITEKRSHTPGKK
jgi:HEAT repeat protein